MGFHPVLEQCAPCLICVISVSHAHLYVRHVLYDTDWGLLQHCGFPFYGPLRVRSWILPSRIPMALYIKNFSEDFSWWFGLLAAFTRPH